MPIAGLTTTGREYGFPRLGKIRKGDEKTPGKPGKDLDYFRFTVNEGREWILKKVQQIYGDEPKELRAWLPYETVTENFDPWMKEYATGSIKRVCDGNQQVLWLDPGKSIYGGVDYGDEPRPCIKKSGGSCLCTRNAPLKVMLPELFNEGICGYFELLTGSKNDIPHIDGVLNYAYQFKQSLVGVPFIVRRVTDSISVPMKDKRVRQDRSLIQIEVDSAWIQKQFTSRYQTMMGIQPQAIAPSFHSGTAPQLNSGVAMLSPVVNVAIEGDEDLTDMPLHRGNINAQIESEMERLKLSKRDAATLLKNQFPGKAKRADLSDLEMKELAELLMGMPTPQPPKVEHDLSPTGLDEEEGEEMAIVPEVLDADDYEDFDTEE